MDYSQVPYWGIKSKFICPLLAWADSKELMWEECPCGTETPGKGGERAPRRASQVTSRKLALSWEHSAALKDFKFGGGKARKRLHDSICILKWRADTKECIGKRNKGTEWRNQKGDCWNYPGGERHWLSPRHEFYQSTLNQSAKAVLSGAGHTPCDCFKHRDWLKVRDKGGCGCTRGGRAVMQNPARKVQTPPGLIKHCPVWSHLYLGVSALESIPRVKDSGQVKLLTEALPFIL